jgi:hypothetical protein
MTIERPRASRKKTPADATPFEREQLRFLLSDSDVAAVLAEVNPSLAWLPVLSEMKLIQSETQLVAWIERNFADLDALRDVVANLHFFGPETANFLEFRLNHQAKSLSPLLKNCWELILRHMRAAKRGIAQNEWFEIAPQLSRGDHSTALLERLANTLRPKLKVSKRLSLYDREKKKPERATDVVLVKYEVEVGVSSSEILAAWPQDASADADEALLSQLTRALSVTLADAMDVGVESNEGYSTSDADVPSVARHPQNEYRSGFQAIVRVMAEVWTRLAAKSPSKANGIAERWRESSFRLLRRLALFAALSPVVPAKSAAVMLVQLPVGDLFLSSSSVEITRLIRAQWKEFPKPRQNAILRRFREGPPRSLFRKGADIDRAVDHARFEVLSTMIRDRLDIGAAGKKLLDEITTRYPSWQPKPPERAGFHVWHESGPRDIADGANKLKNLQDSRLVAEAKRIAANADFLDADVWQGLCLAEPDRALRGLDAATRKRDWPSDFWEQLLWSRTAYADAATEDRIAQLLLQWPVKSFEKVSAAASSWVHERVKTLPDDLLWPLWDKIADATLVESEVTDEVNDA